MFCRPKVCSNLTEHEQIESGKLRTELKDTRESYETRILHLQRDHTHERRELERRYERTHTEEILLCTHIACTSSVLYRLQISFTLWLYFDILSIHEFLFFCFFSFSYEWTFCWSLVVKDELWETGDSSFTYFLHVFIKIWRVFLALNLILHSSLWCFLNRECQRTLSF